MRKYMLFHEIRVHSDMLAAAALEDLGVAMMMHMHDNVTRVGGGELADVTRIRLIRVLFAKMLKQARGFDLLYMAQRTFVSMQFHMTREMRFFTEASITVTTFIRPIIAVHHQVLFKRMTPLAGVVTERTLEGTMVAVDQVNVLFQIMFLMATVTALRTFVKLLV